MNKVYCKLKTVQIRGFKSIKEIDIKLNNLNILIGANGSGKSNFVSFFRMLSFMIDKSEGLKYYVAEKGGADKLFYYGFKNTQEINASFILENNSGEKYKYLMSLSKSDDDMLFFTEEKIAYTGPRKTMEPVPVSLGWGHTDTKLNCIGQDHKRFHTVNVIKNNMRRWRFFQFHDTSKDAYIRNYSDIKDNKYLRDNGGNVAAFLYMLRDHYPVNYKQIVMTVKQMAPFIEDFVLEPDYSGKNIRLGWKEYDKDFEFSADQLSDGTLRAIALTTLLLQPNLPNLICIDEPELGLHPNAINVLADLLKKASTKAQIIVSTQSPALIDNFEMENIIVSDRINGSSQFRRLQEKEYENWLEEYSLSQLWESNLIGGKPSR